MLYSQGLNEITQLPARVKEVVSEVLTEGIINICVLTIKHNHLAIRSRNDNRYSPRNNWFSFCSFLAQKTVRKPNVDEDESAEMMLAIALDFQIAIIQQSLSRFL